MKAIILAAGRGTRLKPLTDESPKCLTEVNGKTILENMLLALTNKGVKEVYLVIGYLGDKIRERVGAKVNNIVINYVENPIYDRTNNTYSLLLALESLTLNEGESLLILEGDVFFNDNLISDFIKHPIDNSTIVEPYNSSLDGSFVEVDNGFILDWTHKLFRPENYVVDDKYKTVNIHKFSKDFVNERLYPSLREHVENDGGTQPIEYVFRDIIKTKNGRISVFLASDYKWIEIDDLSDLRAAESMFK